MTLVVIFNCRYISTVLMAALYQAAIVGAISGGAISGGTISGDAIYQVLLYQTALYHGRYIRRRYIGRRYQAALYQSTPYIKCCYIRQHCIRGAISGGAVSSGGISCRAISGGIISGDTISGGAISGDTILCGGSSAGAQQSALYRASTVFEAMFAIDTDLPEERRNIQMTTIWRLMETWSSSGICSEVSFLSVFFCVSPTPLSSSAHRALRGSDVFLKPVLVSLRGLRRNTKMAFLVMLQVFLIVLQKVMFHRQQLY